MRRTSVAGSWGLILALAASSTAGDAPPPPQAPPVDAPPVLEAPGQPVTPAPARTPSAAPVTPPMVRRSPSTRTTTNLLRPRAVAPPATRSAPPRAPARIEPPPASAVPPFSTPPEAIDAPPPLDGPSLPDVPVDLRPLPDQPVGGVSRRRPADAGTNPILDAPPSLTLEPAGDSPQPLPDGMPDGSEPEKHREKPKRDKIPDDPSERRPSRRFGLFAPPPPRSRNGANSDPSLRVEPRSDPAADAALKRRLEARVKATVGDRARDIEVRVVDRNVVIRAHVDRFWHRRSVRRAIETMPALAGYKAKVEIDD